MRHTWSGILAVVAIAAVVVAQPLRADEPKDNPDTKFVKEANQISLAEIQLGKLAQQKSVNAAIKKYGEKLAQDHTRMNEELGALARKKNITLSKELDSSERQHVDRMSKMSGSEFERAFTKHMIDGHEKAIEKFEMAKKNGRDPDVRAWAEKRIETLKEHLEAARSTLTASR
jgi:putative membrane protein